MNQNFKLWYDGWGRNIIVMLLSAIGIYLFFRYAMNLIAPFLIAWIFAIVLSPVVTFLNTRVKISRGIGTIVSMLTILSTLIGILTGIITQVVQQIISINSELPGMKARIFEGIDGLDAMIQDFSRIIPLPEAFQSVDEILTELLSYITIFIDDIVRLIYVFISNLPNALFFTIVMFIATFFMTKDYFEIKAFVKAQIPDHITNKILVMQQGLKKALGGYIKTQLIIMCFTFVICLVGLLILKREYALVIALGTAVFDALPVFGSGAILITWGIYSVIIGDYAVGIGLWSIYALIVVMRQIVEPKVLSNQIGVYALVTLMAIYIGLQTMGIFGMIIGPVIVVMFKTLQAIGVFPAFKDPKNSKKE